MADEKDRALEILSRRLAREGERRKAVEAALDEASREFEAREIKLNDVRQQLEHEKSHLQEELERIHSAYDVSEQQATQERKTRERLELELAEKAGELAGQQHLHGRMEQEQELIRGELDASNTELIRLRVERADLQQRLKDKDRPRSPKPTAPERAEVIDSTVGIVARSANRVIRLAISFGMVLILYHLIYAPEGIPKIIELFTLMVGSGGGYAIPMALLAGYSPRIIDAIRKLRAGSDD